VVREVSRRKKELGAYYTHQALSDLMSTWAIQSPNSTVLEPSFGGCGFLRSARDRLLSVGSDATNNQLYGCDVDPEAFHHLSTLFERLVDLQCFHEGDFLDQDFPRTWPAVFDTVVGNPPYVPYRKIDVPRRERVLRQLAGVGLELDRRASLWAYFLALGVLYTAPKGRNAWVLPSSFLYANYSKALRKFVSEHFEQCCAFELKERQFLLEGTEEKSIVLLCRSKVEARKHGAESDIPLVQCEGVKDVEVAIRKWDENRNFGGAVCGTSVFNCLSQGPKEVFQELSDRHDPKKLGDLLSVSIGLVTGDNQFFLLSDEERNDANLAFCDVHKILPRFHFATGLNFSSTDHDELLSDGGKGYLVSGICSKDSSLSLQAYLSRYPQDEIEKCSTFRKRAVWSVIEDGAAPDAFFPVMQHNGPRIVLNEDRVNCTNSVHRVYFKKSVNKTIRRLTSLSLLSTFSQISAEISGRSYGSGALKHEPREAERIEVLLPKLHQKTISSAFNRVDRLLRNGNLNEAQQFVDHLLLGALRVESINTKAQLLHAGLRQLKAHRHR